MIKNLSSQEKFIVVAAILTLLFIYSTILFTANSGNHEGVTLNSVNIYEEELSVPDNNSSTAFVFEEEQ
ncbi:hypothetical protein [Bacillus solitudinis]|uniref:hypothetical protein n=1 Tax=Bacillus solitudinis TaxID=2014074 RepID=UPI000C23A356|nr:hypothetical protein [Bacillus solitudinis]